MLRKADGGAAGLVLPATAVGLVLLVALWPRFDGQQHRIRTGKVVVTASRIASQDYKVASNVTVIAQPDSACASQPWTFSPAANLARPRVTK